MTDASGVVVWAADYKPFGEATVTPSSTITNNLRFPGQYYDAETGNHYNYFRDYNSVIGRYGEADPIGLRGGINTYVYTKNNPSNFVDPNGLKCVFNLWLGGAEYKVVGGKAGGAIAECDCVNGQKHTATYAVTGAGLAVGYSYTKMMPYDLITDTFTTNHTTPPETFEYLQISGPSVGFGMYCVGFGDIKAEAINNGLHQGQGLTNGKCAKLGGSIFEFMGMHLIKTGESTQCCK